MAEHLQREDHGSFWKPAKITGILLAAASGYLFDVGRGLSVAYAAGGAVGMATVAGAVIATATVIHRRLSIGAPSEVALLPVQWFRAVFLASATVAAVGAPWTNPAAGFLAAIQVLWASAVLARRAMAIVGRRGGVGA